MERKDRRSEYFDRGNTKDGNVVLPLTLRTYENFTGEDA